MGEGGRVDIPQVTVENGNEAQRRAEPGPTDSQTTADQNPTNEQPRNAAPATDHAVEPGYPRNVHFPGARKLFADEG